MFSFVFSKNKTKWLFADSPSVKKIMGYSFAASFFLAISAIFSYVSLMGGLVWFSVFFVSFASVFFFAGGWYWRQMIICYYADFGGDDNEGFEILVEQSPGRLRAVVSDFVRVTGALVREEQPEDSVQSLRQRVLKKIKVDVYLYCPVILLITACLCFQAVIHILNLHLP